MKDENTLRIVSDGTSRGTKVFVGRRQVKNAVKVAWAARANDAIATAVVEFAKVPVEVVGEERAAGVAPADATKQPPDLRYFDFGHLPPHLQAVSKPFHDAAHALAAVPATDERERAVALRKLLEAKDAAVRSVLPVR